jgi:predicted AAA+ superfamily ATPase
MANRKFLERTLAPDILRISGNDKILLINGPRQIGKTTLLKHAKKPERKYVTLDNRADLAFAKTDPKGFLETYSPPVIIDEIQYAEVRYIIMPYLLALSSFSTEKTPQNPHFYKKPAKNTKNLDTRPKNFYIYT